jgi:hypothetical protein
MRRKIYFEIYSHALRLSLRVAFSLRFIKLAAGSWLRAWAPPFVILGITLATTKAAK